AADSVETAGPAVDPTQSFSLAAWVQLDRLGAAATVLSLNGGRTSAFALDYTPGSFGATFAAADADGAATTRIAAPFAPVADVWYQVAGTCDAASGTARLYVDGRKVAEGAVPAPFAGASATAIGRVLSAGAPSRFWPGTLDEVHLAAAAWADADVAALYAA